MKREGEYPIPLCNSCCNSHDLLLLVGLAMCEMSQLVLGGTAKGHELF